MTNTFEATIASLKSQESHFKQRDEHAVEIGVVLPLLRRVGWNTENISEIYPQRGLSDGSKVDFDLQINGESRIMIEVKKWGHELDDEDEEQLAGYCRDPKDKPKLAALTNGRNWRLYLPPTNRGKTPPVRWFHGVDITSVQPAKVESVFRQFLARDSMVDFGPTLKEARKLYVESRSFQRFKKALTEAWSELANDKATLAELVLHFADKRGIRASEDNVNRFLNSLDWSLVNEAPKPNPGKMPASFALPASPTGKKKMSRQVTKSKGWNNCLLEICELMQSRYPESFRQNILSMTDRFAETENSKFSVPVGDVGIYARFGNAKEIREACYEIVTKFDYPRNSLVIRDSKGADL